SWPRAADTHAAPTSDDSKTISSYLTSTAAQVGSFRVLWLGERWVDPVRPFSRRIDGTPYLITGPQGLTMLDAFEGSPDEGINRLDDSVQALAGRRVHLAGHLLAPASIRFIIVDPNDDGLMSAMRRQRDIALEQQQTHSAIFRNLEWFPRAALIAAGGGKAIPKDPSDVTLMLSNLPSGKDVPASGESDFAAPLPRTRHTRVLLSESFNSGWSASVGSRRLEHGRTLGWINGFDIPPDAKGRLVIRFNRDWIRWLWVLLEALIVTITVTIARSRRREVTGWLR
ncbi:MAG TPA: hypothetical protein VI541_01965, partial [Actinomycetota bacterium]|nr:hypothetical protein [Actinomycetota bacterium]